MIYSVYKRHIMGYMLVEADVLPTPRLIDEGTRHDVEAYRDHDSDKYSTCKGGYWRIRDEASDAEGRTYQKVRIEAVPEPNPFDLLD